MTVITAPGVYPDISDTVYQADPVPGGSLSVSGARRLLPPSCPAAYKWWREHGQAPKREFDVGRAAHKLVTGYGPPLVQVDAVDWRTKDAREARDSAYEQGAVPLLPGDYRAVYGMAEALRAHPVASALFAPGSGEPEQSVFWRDPDADVSLRARPDWLPYPGTGRMIIPDYKSTKAASLESIQRSIYDYGYVQQGPWYLAGLRAVGAADDDAVFVFVFQERVEPYLITIAELDPVAARVGRAMNRRAIETYARCTASGEWPGYADDVVQVGLPSWAEWRLIGEYL